MTFLSPTGVHARDVPMANFSVQNFKNRGPQFHTGLVPNVVVSWTVLILRIPNVPGSNLGLETRYPSWHLSWLPLVSRIIPLPPNPSSILLCHLTLYNICSWYKVVKHAKNQLANALDAVRLAVARFLFYVMTLFHLHRLWQHQMVGWMKDERERPWPILNIIATFAWRTEQVLTTVAGCVC
jgi:hypothetical protein